MFTLPFVAWGKGKIKEISAGFITTLGIISGLSNFIYLNNLQWYPLVHFATFHSIFYHGMMIFIGLYLLTSGYYKPTIRSVFYSELVVIIFSAFAIPVTYELFYTKGGCDYMLYTLGASLPVIGDLAIKARQANCLSLFTIGLMTVGYTTLSFIAFGVYKLINIITNKHKLVKE